MDKKPSFPARMYYFLTNFLDTNLTELFAGISIGIAINLATEQDIPFLTLIAIVLLLASVLFQLILTRIRQRINYNLADRDGLEMTAEDKWMAAAGYDNPTRVGLFFISLVLGMASFAGGIYFIYQSKQTANSAEQVQLKEQSERIIRLQADSIATREKLKKLTDSIYTIPGKKTIVKQ